MRIAHCRFINRKPVRKQERFDRVVTTAWQFYPDEGILSYGATIYSKSHDHWNRKKHVERAIERFNKNPILIRLEKDIEPSNTAIKNCIAQKLVFEYGTHNKHDENCGALFIDSNFNDRYTPFPKVSFAPPEYLKTGFSLLGLFLLYKCAVIIL